jgi:hypothetical protein
MFDTEMSYFKDHQDELVANHNGRVLVICGQQVVGVYDDALAAYLAASKDRAPGSFMIQPCSPGPAAYTVTIASSVTW